MTSSTVTSVGALDTPRTGARYIGVDLARGVAVLGMFVAHTAPSAGPADVLMLSEYFPFPLFALLLGGGAELVARRMRVRRHAAESIVRAFVLIALGWALTQAGANVAVVLGPLGVAVAVGWLLSVLPSAALVVGAVAGFTFTGTWVTRVEEWRFEMLMSQKTRALDWTDLVLSSYYPLPFVLACAALGVVVVRLLHPRPGTREPGRGLLLCGGLALVAAAGALLVLGRLGRLDTATTSWGWATTTASLALAVAVCFLCEWLARVTPGAWTKPVHAVGAMAFTAYSLHILWLALWARALFPGEPDDAWSNVFGMSAVAIVAALAWQALPLRGRWWRGPLEGLVGTMTGYVGRKVDGGAVDAKNQVSLRQTSRPGVDARR